MFLKQSKDDEKTTSDGYAWLAVPTGWKDLTSGLIWKYEDEQGGEYTFDDAVTKFGDGVPSKKELEEAESHGIREVIDLQGKFYWSSSVYSKNPSYAWYFFFCSGLGSDFVTKDVMGLVRCIDRQHKGEIYEFSKRNV